MQKNTRDLMTRKAWATYVHNSVCVLLVGSIGFYIYQTNWSSVFYTTLILLLVLTPMLLKKYSEIEIPVELDAGIGVFIFLTLFLGVLHNFYMRYPIWDSILHLQSGFLLSIGGFVLIYIMNGKNNKYLHLTPGFIALSSFNFSLALGIVWEIYEYIADTFFGYHMQFGGLTDTMEDMILNTIGALIVSVIGYLWMIKKNRLPLFGRRVKIDK